MLFFSDHPHPAIYTSELHCSMSAQFLPELLDTSLTILNEDFPLSFFLQVSNSTDGYPVTLVGSLNRVYLHRKETDFILFFF